MMKLKVRRAKCRVKFDYRLTGSVLKQTVKATWDSVATHLELDSEEPMEKILALVRNAKGGCFAENLVTQQVPLVSKVTLRGRTVDLGERK